jgi:diguanylate cyclase (GGDEF)-like protein
MSETLPLPVPTSFEACTEDLIAASLSLEKNLQAGFARDLFQSLLGLSLNIEQSYDAWQNIQERRSRLKSEKGQDIPLRQALLEYFLHSPLLREPIVTDFGELQRLRRTSTTDHLTGTHNRNFFDISLAKEVGRAVRYNDEFSLILMDLNQFKAVNDTHGHATGDGLLALTGKLLVESARTSDYAFRMGGDEFALLLPRTAQPSATLLAERLCQRFREAVEAEDLTVSVSMSYGVATCPREARDPKILYELADRRLYDFKRAVSAPRCSPRRFERIPLREIDAYVMVKDNSHVRRGRLLDFSIGGIGLRVPPGIELPDSFSADLYLRVLPPVAVDLRKVYVGEEQPRGRRLGCAFSEPATGPVNLPAAQA